jgi:hypothetical protein
MASFMTVMSCSIKNGLKNKPIYFPGFACIEPPIPPNETHLIRHYSGGDTTAFGKVVNYTCEPGYFFGEDYDQGSDSTQISAKFFSQNTSD